MNEQTLTRETSIYFVLAERLNAVKIGITFDVQARLKELQVGSSVQLRLLGMIPGTLQTERDFHYTYSHLWLRGEWFRLEDELADFIREAFPLDADYNSTAFCGPRIQDACASDFLLNIGPTVDVRTHRTRRILEQAQHYFKTQHLVMEEATLAELLGIPLEQLKRARKQGKFSYYKSGRGARYGMHHIEDMIDRRVFDLTGVTE